MNFGDVDKFSNKRKLEVRRWKMESGNLSGMVPEALEGQPVRFSWSKNESNPLHPNHRCPKIEIHGEHGRPPKNGVNTDYTDFTEQIREHLFHFDIKNEIWINGLNRWIPMQNLSVSVSLVLSVFKTFSSICESPHSKSPTKWAITPHLCFKRVNPTANDKTKQAKKAYFPDFADTHSAIDSRVFSQE